VDAGALTSGAAPELNYEPLSKRIYVLGDRGLGRLDPATGSLEIVPGAPAGRHPCPFIPSADDKNAELKRCLCLREF